MKGCDSPARQGLILVCEECEKKSPFRDDGSVRKDLKKQLKELHGKGQWKVLSVSCLSLCPKGRVAVALVPARGPVRFMAVNEQDLADLAARLTSEKELPGP